MNFQCRLGCSLWLEGLENSCQTVCVSKYNNLQLYIYIYNLTKINVIKCSILFQNVTSETVFSRELYCVMGCNEALNAYFQNIRGKLK